jgi:uroporphyrinogen-III synthase
MNDAHDPLQGRRILVTRPDEAGESLARALAQRGALPLYAPAIRIAIDPEAPAIPQARAALARADRLLLSSRYGLVALMANRATIAKSAGVYAVGAQTAKLAAGAGFEVLIAADAGGLVALVEAIGKRESATKLRILWPCGDLAESAAVEPLRARAFEVEAIAVYKTVNAYAGGQAPSPERLIEMEAAVFASPSAVESFMSTVDPGALGIATSRWKIAVIGETTRAAAAAAGWQNVFTAAEPGNAGLTAALETAFAS